MLNVFFSGSGTWFDKNDGNLLYPLIDKTRPSHSFFYSFPPVHSINGIFSINDEDSKIYTHTGNLDHIRKLYPNTQPDSAFLKMVTEGILLNKDINHCFFKLPRKRKKTNGSRVERNKLILVIANEKTTTQTNSKKKPENKVLKDRYAGKSDLTNLIHTFLESIDIYPGDPRPFDSGIAWNKITLEYKDEDNLILSIAEDKRSIFLNSVEKKEIDLPYFRKSYNAQFIAKISK